MFPSFLKSVLLASGFMAATNALNHQLIVGTFGTPYLYTLEFEDAARTLTLSANTSVNHDKKVIYGNAFEDTGSSVYVSYPLTNDLQISPGNIVTSQGACEQLSIFVRPSPVSPYAVYGQPFGACGTVMSVDSNSLLVESIQEYNYSSSSGVHGTAFDPAGAFMYSLDDTGNAIWVHSVDNTTGELTYVANVTAPVEGADPRHGTVHPTGNYLYVVHEGTNEVGVYKIDTSTGIPAYADISYPLIPDGANDTEYWSDEVALSYSAKYLWATSRARNTNSTGYISILALNDDGSVNKQNFLTPTTSSGGSANAVTPSDFGDQFVAITDSSAGFVEIWEMGDDGASADVVAHLDLNDGGCCANAVWLP
ncbi:carboxy-cis,cis-muconate cyclase [Colletotrichum lupini]|nr:carboxy-cis,cis-muconate cyclase [Colletotrichum lupini]